jgi:hypothetical protein
MPANAALYLPHAHIDLAPLFPDVVTKYDLNNAPITFSFTLNDDHVRYNVMPRDRMNPHLLGFRNYVKKLAGTDQQKRVAETYIFQTKTVLGLVTAGDFEGNQPLWDSLFQIAVAFAGCIFVLDSILTPTGDVIIGPLANDQA